MTVLSRLAKLGIASETSQAVYAPPVFTVVFDRARYKRAITPLRDKALRGSDSDLQDYQQGPAWSEWTIPGQFYPDLAGWYLRGMIGADTCTPGVTTTTTAFTEPGVTSLSLAAAPASNAVIMIGAGATLEYAKLGTVVSGAVPIATPATGLLYQHAAGEPVVSQATHSFAQNQEGPSFGIWPSYSLTMDDGTGPLGWPGCVFGSLTISVPLDGMAKLSATATGYPPAAQDTFAYAATAAQPAYEWAVGVVDSGLTRDDGLGLDVTLTRKLGVFPAVCGQQAPVGIWPGPLQVDSTYRSNFENNFDMSSFVSNVQDPAVYSLTQPVLSGGSKLTLTIPKTGWWDAFASQDEVYMSATYKIQGIASPFGGSACSATLLNFWQSAYA